MSELTEEQIDQIRARAENGSLCRYREALDAGLSDHEAREDGWPSVGTLADVPLLLAEVDRLKAELAAEKKRTAAAIARNARLWARLEAEEAENRRLLPVVEAAKADLTKAQTLIEVLSADQPDGEEYDAAERKLREAWPTIFGNDPVFCEQVVTLALDSAWAVNHPRRVAAVARSARRNPHCSNCGDLRGGPFGHEISECTFQREAVRRVSS